MIKNAVQLVTLPSPQLLLDLIALALNVLIWIAPTTLSLDAIPRLVCCTPLPAHDTDQCPLINLRIRPMPWERSNLFILADG